MSKMEVTEDVNDCSNDLLLLDRVFLRLGNADSDEQLESCLNRFLCPVILKLSSPHEQVRTKVMELLVHVNKRVKSRTALRLPVATLLDLYKDPAANSFIINFSIIYITMGYPRLSKEEQLTLAPLMIEAIENKPQGHQDQILMLVVPLLGEIKESNLTFKDKPKVASQILKFATDILLLPYRALPSSGESESEFQVPAGLSARSYRRLVDKGPLDADRLEEMKQSVVRALGGGGGELWAGGAALLPLVVAAADSRFSVANLAHSPLARAVSEVDWSAPATVAPLYQLYLGSWSRDTKVAPDDKKVPACARLRLKLIVHLTRARGPAIMFPHCVQVVFASLFEESSNARLRTLALAFLRNVIDNGDEAPLQQVAGVFLAGLLKLVRGEQYTDHHKQALACLGALTRRAPACVRRQTALLEELVARVPAAPPDGKMALRDALLDMAAAFIIPEASAAMDTEGAEGGAGGAATADTLDEPHVRALFALLEHYGSSADGCVRYVAVRLAAAVFPPRYVPARYLLLCAAADSQDDISSEALKSLYGASRPNEIEDVVNNVSKKEKPASLEEDSKRDKNKVSAPEFRPPDFEDVVNYIWDQIEKRKKGSNPKHRFVVNNQVLPFHPLTYQEMVRYMRMCLHRAAELTMCAPHPNAASPKLATFLRERLPPAVLDKYLAMLAALLTVHPEEVPLSCFADVASCVPDRAVRPPGVPSILGVLRRILESSTRDHVRELAAATYGSLLVAEHATSPAALDSEVADLLQLSKANRSLEAQCGALCAAAAACERAIWAARRGAFGGADFSPAVWSPYKDTVLAAGDLVASPQQAAVWAACGTLGLLARAAALPLPDHSPAQLERLQGEVPFVGGADTEPELTKFGVAEGLLRVAGGVGGGAGRVRERALSALGALCVGHTLPFARHIARALLLMARDSKDFEIHLQIGESLVMCAEGVNSNEHRDMWNTPPEEGAAKVKDEEAQKQNDELLEWLLDELFSLSAQPHPNSRQASGAWLVALVRSCGAREPVRRRLPRLQDAFMELLAEDSELLQDVASKGLALVYEQSEEAARRELVAALVDRLAGGVRAVRRVAPDSKVFEEGQLGAAPTGGNLSTYRELCALASDLNQPDLLYQFMHLAHHNNVWNSKRGAAFGFQSLAATAGAQLAEHLPRIVPRLYRYRHDPTPRLQAAVSSIWHALVPDTQRAVQKYHKEILEDLVTNLVSNQWRVRMSCCLALADLMRTAGSMHEWRGELERVWQHVFRVMDDVHEGTRHAATNTAQLLSKLCVRATDAEAGADGRQVLAVILPVLLDTGITHVVREVRAISLQTVSQLVKAAGASLKPFLARLVPALVEAAGELESTRLSYLSTALGTDTDTREALDNLRASAAKQHYTTDTVVKCMPWIDMEVFREMSPRLVELCRSPALATRAACAHVIVLCAHHLRGELAEGTGGPVPRLLAALMAGALDRNAAVRRCSADALGQLAAYAKPSSVEKVIRKLVAAYEGAEEGAARGAVGGALRALGRARPEHLQEHAAVLAPLIFLAMHAPADDEESAVESFEELWSELSPAKARGVREHLPAIRERLQTALDSSSWTGKVQAAKAVRTVCTELRHELSEREALVKAVLAAARCPTFPGKEHLLEALADLADAPAGEEELTEQCVTALLAESRKSEPRYKTLSFTALASALTHSKADHFQEVYVIVKPVLSQEGSARDSDDEGEGSSGADGARGDLRDAAYTLLARAWPADGVTQAQYQEEFFSQCAARYPASARRTQLALLAALAEVLPRLYILKAGEPMETDADASAAHTDKDAAKDAAVSSLVRHCATIVDHTLTNSNQTRPRREALRVLQLLAGSLAAGGRSSDLTILRRVLAAHEAGLARAESHELRAALDNVRVHLK